MDLVDYDNNHSGQIKELHLKMRDHTDKNECEIWFDMKFKMGADVNAVIVKVHEIYEQGEVHGWCYSKDTDTKYALEKVDALMIFDGSVL